MNIFQILNNFETLNISKIVPFFFIKSGTILEIYTTHITWSQRGQRRKEEREEHKGAGRSGYTL